MKVFVVAALHGDEIFGLKIADKIRQNGAKNCKIRIGNPEAVAKGKRYLQTDLNRSFNTNLESIETSLAQDIEKDIRSYNPDFIIDIHTSISDMGMYAIVAHNNITTHGVAMALGMDAIITMPKRYSRHSLIGTFPNNSLSIEFGKKHRSDKLAQEVADKILTLRQPTSKDTMILPIYKVVSTIDKDFPGLEQVINLEFNKELRGYPFLAGKNNYQTSGGFLAQREHDNYKV